MIMIVVIEIMTGDNQDNGTIIRTTKISVPILKKKMCFISAKIYLLHERKLKH